MGRKGVREGKGKKSREKLREWKAKCSPRGFCLALSMGGKLFR